MRRLLFLGLAILSFGLVACGGSSSGGSGPASAPAGSFPVELMDYSIHGTGVTGVHAGAIDFFVVNKGQGPHNFTVEDSTGNVIGKSRDLAPGETQLVTISLSTGSYKYLCTQPGHASLGMSGTLTVS